MGFKEATPGLIITLASTIILGIVSFNTPLLKSLYFLKATYTDGSINGTATFGTLGYCFDYTYATTTGGSNCTSPTVGYSFDINTIFGLSTDVVSIPTAVSKYLTYVLVLHLVAFVASFAALILGGLSHIRNFSLLCFPSFLAWLASATTLLALVVDLIMFYIAKARINAVSGASATIGICVWLTLAAWLLTMIAGLAYTCGMCCARGNRKGQDESRKMRDYQEVQSNNEHGYPPKQGPPIREQEVSVPLNRALTPEAKYLEEEAGENPSQLGYNQAGREITDVGYGYGARPGRQPSNAGYPPRQNSGSQDYHDPYGQRHQQGYSNGYAGGAAYGAPGYVPGGQDYSGVAGAGAYGAGGYDQPRGISDQAHDPYGYQNGAYDQHAYEPQDGSQENHYNPYPQENMPEPRPVSPESIENHVNPYTNPQPAAHYASQDAYGGYQTPNVAHPGVSPNAGYQQGYNNMAPLAPQPQRLDTNLHQGAPQFSLDATSPLSPNGGMGGYAYPDTARGAQRASNGYDDHTDITGPAPPSYLAVADPGTGRVARQGENQKSAGYFQ